MVSSKFSKAKKDYSSNDHSVPSVAGENLSWKKVLAWIDTFWLIYYMMSDKKGWSQSKLAWMSSFLNNFSVKRAPRDLFNYVVLHETICSQAPVFLRPMKTMTKFSNVIGYHQTDSLYFLKTNKIARARRKNTGWLIIIKHKQSARVKCKNHLFKPCVRSKQPR